MPADPAADFLTAKSDDELRFLAQNPTYYHPDLVQAAQRELRRRGVAPAPLPAPLELEPAPEEYAAPARPRWLLPAVGGGLVLAALALLLRFGSQPAPSRPKAVGPPPPLVAVETHQMPSFAALTEQQLRRMPAALPPHEADDSVARRKYLELARRYWDAENQSAYLYRQARTGQHLETLPALVETTLDKWHFLTRVLVYDHKLKPGMTARVELMRQGASVRMHTLNRMSMLQQNGEFPVDDDLTFLNDSVEYMGQLLLGVPRAQQRRPVRRHQDFLAGSPAAALRSMQQAGYRERYSVYVVDGEVFVDALEDDAVPAVVQELDPAAVLTLTALSKQEAVRRYGEQAYNGALVITTRHPNQ